MKKIKLQLEINLLDEIEIKNNQSFKVYNLYIKFLDKDERFEASLLNKSKRFIYFEGSNGFKINSIWNEPFGKILHNGLLIPKLDHIGFRLKQSFTSDKDRYIFLKKLYHVLKEWSNNWLGFEKECITDIKINGNSWIVYCIKNHSNHVSHSQLRNKMRNIWY